MKHPLQISDKVNLIMCDINDAQIRFSFKTVDIKDPAALARHLSTIELDTAQI